MDISFLLGMVNPLILGMCLAVGYALKMAFEGFPNRFIPLAALSCGFLLSVILHWKSGINAEIMLGGMISGLASTGLYEMLRNLLKFDGKSEKGEEGAEED